MQLLPTYTHTFAGKLSVSLQPGIYFERYSIRGYGTVFKVQGRPTLTANYAIGDNQSVYADWSMGTSVPTMSAYNNTEQRVDHHTVKRGNPELDITKMHFVNVGYNLSARWATCRCSASTISLPTCLSRITRPRATPW